MKNLSIKMKVTIWYTGLVVAIMLLVLAFIFASSDKLLLFKLEDNLKEVVKEAAEEIEFRDGRLEIEEDMDYNEDGIDLLIYDNQGERIGGGSSTGFVSDTPFESNQIQSIKKGNQEWLVYDLKYNAGGNQHVWVRGITTMNQLSEAMNSIMIVALISIPFFVIIAASGGYFITRKAFRPVQQMIDAASHIQDGNDLTKRINLQGSHDEIYDLGQTFDTMFDRLQQSFESEKQFTSDASHELRTPTSVIISESEYALSQMDNKQEVKESLEVIHKQANKMSALVSQLLQIARADSKKENMIFEEFNMSELSEIVVEELSMMAKAAEIALTSDIQPDLYMKADQTLMTRLLMNLLTNGINYGKAGGYVDLKLFRQDNWIIGEVSDNGIGIEEEHIPKIWDRFYRIDSSRTSSQSGNVGLGLSMVKWIVEIHGGTVYVESEIEKGTTFIFKIPDKEL